ncbi:succinate dehydrogenase hydrophobic membrane anchor subunit [Streptomyces sp. SID13666]|jgi:succinate dehydrogenase / fumarate reductase, membrane anchor subunit|uniref:succinate dehydrogenase hydrophobic membrane anchor subunit n=1 Tax=Streptomyces TaxID=1883 RepID=UPI001105DC6A|nr:MULTISPECIES: succinate dehydrogenase hydrophobic membrane anchor subunit [Streptomyces]MCZ4099612.1 succinate dehydrogenase hydrophobic membrane anchor subunit [Streptomyces sp. H39-C1]NEA58914.1 succinate dehydrogenase hydrophobic membrane anchor subunit [Streptomyces sp. SID13666]NEA72974.1 succinate dehydrogenase hydrophobic membrane anchor subunit [Streptomyces sp. SID13588]QNA74933.1 succinate dehydrogenase hydrophobic membrane anchor subunit [Streptomyces sp. So13.3]
MSTDSVELSSSSASFSPENPAPFIEAPRARTKRTPRATRTNFELYGWLFMRLSGVVLVVLVLGHLLIQLVLDGGVTKVGFAFVAGRWASPFWQGWDLVMLWLAMLHGGNGLRTVINDYAEQANTRFWLKTLLFTATAFTIVLGTLVIFTFDPNIR